MQALFPTITFIVLTGLIYLALMTSHGLLARWLRRRERHHREMQQAASEFSESKWPRDS